MFQTIVLETFGESPFPAVNMHNAMVYPNPMRAKRPMSFSGPRERRAALSMKAEQSYVGR
jgi:hypothetical protein